MLFQGAVLIRMLLSGLPVDGASMSDLPSTSKFKATIKVQMQLKGLVGNDSSGAFLLRLHPGWAPRGVRRFLKLLEEQFFDNCRFFRVKSGFVAQFGISPEPDITDKWKQHGFLEDDPVLVSNRKGTLSFATTGEMDSRSTQLFFNLQDNTDLDGTGFAPIGEVDQEGLSVLNRIFAGYHKVSQKRIEAEGEEYLAKKYPKMSIIKQARLITSGADAEALMKIGIEEAAKAIPLPQTPRQGNTQVHSVRTRWTIVGGCVGAIVAFTSLVLLLGRFGSLWERILVTKGDHPIYDDYLPSSPSKMVALDPTDEDQEIVQPGNLDYDARGKVQLATDMEDCETAGLLHTPSDPPAQILGARSSDQ